MPGETIAQDGQGVTWVIHEVPQTDEQKKSRTWVNGQFFAYVDPSSDQARVYPDEPADLGPYPTRQAAEQAVDKYSQEHTAAVGTVVTAAPPARTSMLWVWLVVGLMVLKRGR